MEIQLAKAKAKHFELKLALKKAVFKVS